MHISTISGVEKSLRRCEKPPEAASTRMRPFMNCSRAYFDQSLAPGSVISCVRICRNSVCSGASADCTVQPGFSRANICTQRARGSSMWTQPHSGTAIGFIWMGTRICGDRVGSRPEKPAAETPTIVIG